MHDVLVMWLPVLTQIVRLGLPGVHEPGLELELSEDDLAICKKKKINCFHFTFYHFFIIVN